MSLPSCGPSFQPQATRHILRRYKYRTRAASSQKGMEPRVVRKGITRPQEQHNRHTTAPEEKAILHVCKTKLISLEMDMKRKWRQTEPPVVVELIIADAWKQATAVFEGTMIQLSEKIHEVKDRQRQATLQLEQTSALFQGFNRQRYPTAGPARPVGSIADDPVTAWCKKHHVYLHYLKKKMGINARGCTSADQGRKCRFAHECPVGVELPKIRFEL